MEKIKQRWGIETTRELLIIFFIFSITGSSSVMIGRPMLKALGLTLNNVQAIVYYPLFIIASFIFYQLFLVAFGWIFGQFQFFWNMEKKMLKRFGISI